MIDIGHEDLWIDFAFDLGGGDVINKSLLVAWKPGSVKVCRWPTRSAPDQRED